MKVAKYICCTLLTLNFATLGSSLEPVTIAIGSVVGLGSLFAAALWEPFRCRLVPCCNNRWIIRNFTGLEHDMKSKLHGQPLASQIVVQHVKAHLKDDSPSKALVLSFHGPTGVGKTFVSDIIVVNMYKDGQHSPYVHLISAMRDFPHQEMSYLYQNQLKKWIKENVTNCERSVFIFEEIDKLPAGFLDILVPYVDYRTGSIYNKAIFIFLSNTGSSDIVKVTFDHWKSGESRETLQNTELQKTIMEAVNEDQDYGLWKSHLMSNNLIDAFVPFLPLEKIHVTKCITDALVANKNVLHILQTQKIVDYVIEQLTFSPLEEPVFSDMGCKRVGQKIYEALE